MIDRLMGALLSVSSWTGGLVWTTAWQSTLWLAVGMVAARIWRRRAGRAHLLLILSTSAAVVSPLLTESVRRMEWGVLPPPPAVPEDSPVVVVAPSEPTREVRAAEPGDVSFDELPQESREPATNQAPEPDREEQVATLPPPKTEPDPEPAAQPAKPSWTAGITERIPAAVAGLWLCASLILTIRLVLSLFSGRRIVRAAQEETSPRLLESLRDAAGALGLRSPPLLRVSPKIRCPMIWCWGARPVVLLPESAAQQPQILWRSVFCHELAHLVRRDHWSALWAELLIIIVPWQPLAWRARRRLAFLREQACDDWVLSVGGEATDYAESLLQLVPQGSPVHALAAVSSREALKRRLEHVLAGVRITPKVGRRWIVAASLFALAAIAGVGFAQQGKRSAAPSPESAPQLEVAQETKPPTSPAAATTSTTLPPATPLPQPTHAPQPAQNPAPAALPAGVIAVHGRVLLPNGQPAVGATVRVLKAMFRPGSFIRGDKVKLLATLHTDVKSEFDANVDVGPLTEPVKKVRLRETPKVTLWATMPGYGAVPHHLVVAEKTGSIVLRFVDEEPIRGRLMDMEGRPVRDARVEVITHYETTSALIDEWLASATGKKAPARSIIELIDRPLEWAQHNQQYAILRVSEIDSVSEALFPVVSTNSEGRFELRGVGRDRRVELRISGPRMTAFPVGVVTRTMKSVPSGWNEVSGSQFERVVQPSVPVEGFVTDEESGKPIDGALVLPQSVGREHAMVQGLGAPVWAATDAKGHYRLEGLETLNDNDLMVIVPESEYFWARFVDVPRSKSLEPLHRDVKLKHGVRALVRVYDRTTGKAVPSGLSYQPYKSNEFVQKYPPIQRDFDYLFDDRPDAEGRYRKLVIPGRGVIAVRCQTGDYRFDFGKASIKKSDDPLPSVDVFHAVREINPGANDQEIRVDIPVDPGQNILLKFTDAAGNRLAGVEAYGLRFVPGSYGAERGRSFVAGDTAILYAASPDEPRSVWLKHRATGLTRLFEFKPKAGETQRTIVLEPPAILTGRLLNPEGAPLAQLRIECRFGRGQAGEFPATSTDEQGRFRQGLPGGGPYFVRSPSFGRLEDKLTAFSGEQVDFGDITVDINQDRPRLSKPLRGPEKRTKPPAAVKASTASADAPSVGKAPVRDVSASGTPTTIREIRGRVLLPNGQPAAGATVRAMTAAGTPFNFPKFEAKLLGAFSTTADGGFEGKISLPLGTQPRAVTRVLNSQARRQLARDEGVAVNLWATMPGYGLAIVPLDSFEGNDPIVIKLADEEPIRGHLIDLEARPVRDAKVEVMSYVETISSGVDEALATTLAMKKEDRLALSLRNQGHEFVSPSILPSVNTDSDGRFELRGFGRDRMVELRISAPHLTATIAHVLTRPIKPIQLRFHDVFGSQFERAIPPSVPVEGFVTDEETGKPIPGRGSFSSPSITSTAFGPICRPRRMLTDTIGSRGWILDQSTSSRSSFPTCLTSPRPSVSTPPRRWSRSGKTSSSGMVSGSSVERTTARRASPSPARSLTSHFSRTSSRENFEMGGAALRGRAAPPAPTETFAPL